MCSFVVCMGLLLVIVMSMLGCAMVTPVAGSRHVTLIATVESSWERQTQQLAQEGIITASARQSLALAEFTPRSDLYWTRLAMWLEHGKSEGKAICELEETYRVNEDGEYTVRLDGVAEAGPIPVDTIEYELEISIEVRSGVDNHVIGQMFRTIRPRIATLESQSWLWLSPSEKLDPLTVEMKADDEYLVHTRLALSARRGLRTSDKTMSVDGGFRLVVEPMSQVQTREELARSLAQELTAMWSREGLEIAENPQLQDAAQSLSRLFLNEAVWYVDIHIPRDNRFACYEHARIVREWYESRMRLDSNLARWFRMTTVRRDTLLIWQSSNLITPNVKEDPEGWLYDGTGIVLEPKIGAAGDFYGRYLTAEEFQMWGKLPKLQRTAQSFSRSDEYIP
ncbi:MAG: hypothetical protein ACE5KZ_02610 [Candidatus Scalinduaceae bacterium]